VLDWDGFGIVLGTVFLVSASFTCCFMDKDGLLQRNLLSTGSERGVGAAIFLFFDSFFYLFSLLVDIDSPVELWLFLLRWEERDDSSLGICGYLDLEFKMNSSETRLLMYSCPFVYTVSAFCFSTCVGSLLYCYWAAFL